MIDLLEHRDKKIYVVEISDFLDTHQVFFKKIPHGEYKHIKHYQQYASIPLYELENQVVREYVVYPPMSDDMIARYPAGLITTLAQIILRLSSDNMDVSSAEGVAAFNDRMQALRYMAISSADLQMYSTICSVYRGYQFEDLEKLSFDKIMQLFACAERHMLNIGALTQPVEFFNLEEAYASQQEEEKQKEEKVSPIQEVSPGANVDDLMAMAAKNSQVQGTSMGPEEKPKKSSKEAREEERLRQIAQARQGIQSKRGYVAPAQKRVDANGVDMAVVGINMNQGFDDSDWEVPELTEEEALAAAAELELFPAGQEIIDRRKAQEKERQRKEAIKEAKNQPKIYSLKQLRAKKLREKNKKKDD